MAIETQWKRVHPRAWDILEEDDRKDWDEHARIGAEYERALLQGNVTADEEEKVKELQTKLRDRIIMRSGRLLGASV